MLNKVIRRLVLSYLAACLFALAAFAQDYKALLGKWSMTSETDGGESVNWTLVLKDDDGKLAAYLSADSGEQAAKNFSYKDGVLKFEAPYQGDYYDLDLKVSGDKLDGTWSGNGDSGRTTGVKAAAQ